MASPQTETKGGAGTVAAGCRMDRESLGFIGSNPGSKDCAVPCSSIIDALKRKNELLIKQTLFNSLLLLIILI